MPKNIVVFADGTGQDGGVTNNTNVYDLFNIIEDRSVQQISFYDRGLGTERRKLEALAAMAFGTGIARNTQECYEFISDHYTNGDQIYLFGFSRGATTVRTLAAFIHRFGILPRSRPELIQRAYKIYKISDKEERRNQATEFLNRNHTMWCRIRFLGVWDTVAALGIPFKRMNRLANFLTGFKRFNHSYHDLRLSKCVDFARHAVAIDDERLTFHPCLWDERVERGESRRRRPSTLDVSVDDITDIYLTATKLKAKADPISTRIRDSFIDNDREIMRLLNEFEGYLPGLHRREDELGMATSHEKRLHAEELKTALASVFTEAIKAGPLFERKQPGPIEGMELSNETKELLHRDGLDHKRLNRRLLEDAYALKTANPPRVKQVWFPGMHSDVGGGYAENELAHVPMLWMLREAMDAGLLIYPKHKVDFRPDANGTMHDSRENSGRVFRRSVRSWDPSKHQGRKALVHESVLMRQQCDDLQYEPWILKQEIKVEPWPAALRSSVQFDDYYIWREAIWGFDSAFAVPWSCVKRVSYGQSERTLKLYIRGDERNPVLIRGVPGSLATDIASAFERRKEEAQEQLQERTLSRLNANDKKHREGIATLEGEVATLKKQLAEANGKTRRTKTKRKATAKPAPR